MEAAAKTFFSSPRFAVAGASQDPTKFGHRIFAWYLAHSIPATPINPRQSSITVSGTPYPTVASPSALPSPAETSLSIITPPAVTINLLKEAKEAGIPAVWLQPGTYNDEILDYATKEFKAAVGGEGGGGSEGWCVLVDGEEGLSSAGKDWRSQKL